MKHCWTLLIVLMSIRAFGLPDDALKDLQQDIKDNDFKRVETAVGTESLSKEYLLWEAAIPRQGTMWATQGVCRTEIVKFLISKGLKVGGPDKDILLESAFSGGCTEIAKLIISHYDSDEIGKATQAWLEYSYGPQEHSSFKNTFLNENGKIIDFMFEENKKHCPSVDENSKNINCVVLANRRGISLLKVKSEIAKLQEQKESELAKEKERAEESRKEMETKRAEEEFAKSPEGTKAKACDVQKELTFAMEQIAYQTRLEKESGVANLSARRQLAASKIRSEDELKELKKIYKKQTGKTLAFKDCPKKD